MVEMISQLLETIRAERAEEIAKLRYEFTKMMKGGRHGT
jgi:hypothetical protein